MKVNGEEKMITAPVSILAYLQENGYDPTRVAVERGGAIVPRAQFEGTVLSNEDTLEIVTFVGGG